MTINSRPYVTLFPVLPVMLLCLSVISFWSAFSCEARAEIKAPPAASDFDPVKSVSLTSSRQTLTIRQNQQIGDILVITGRAKNNSDRPISFLRLRASLLNSDGRALAERYFYAGNTFSGDELESLSANQIVARLNARDGQEGRNLNIKPGADLPFMVVFLNIPKDRSAHHIEVVSASPAGPPAETKKNESPAPIYEDSTSGITFSRGNQNHYFRKNNEAGNILIITGLVKNSFPDKRSFIRLRGHLLGSSGQTLSDRYSYAGNTILEDELRTLPIKEIFSRLSLKGGQDGRNQNIEPGQEIPFMIVFDKLPDSMVEYRIDPVSSEPAGD